MNEEPQPMISNVEARYGFAKQLASLTEKQLVARFNGEVRVRAWLNDNR